ncbi:PLSCR3 [Cordylochernes scorpioides]|uniref:PLSCR3 n=1 Tax=Cordylochernes scorpioides TaxID=51811 RepID=A0ABY6L6S1_9ARAC|nr:PLSCR3 [Cordylochernes scorpioides]
MRCLRLEASALNGYLERWSFRSTEGTVDVLPDLSCELEQVLGPSGDVCMEELSEIDLIHILESPQDVCMPGELSHLSPLDIEQVLGIPEQGGLDNAPTVDDLTLSRILEAEFHFSSLEEKLDSFEADIIDILQQALQRHKTIRFFLQTEVELIKTNDASDLRYIRRFRSHFTAQPRPFQILCPRTVFVLLYRGRSGVKYRPQRNLSRRESSGKVLVEFILNSFKAKRTSQKISFRRYERATKKNDFLNEQTCHICEKQLDIKTKVIDHCHWSGRYRGAAHNICNLNYHNNSKFRCLLHGAKNYDNHFLIKALRHVPHKHLKIIPMNMEKYSVILVDDVIFLDSFQFLSASLNTLSSNLPQDGFKVLSQCFPYQTDLLRRKGVYPYEYMTDSSKFSETSLPPIEYFSSKLLNESCSNESYAFAQQVWEELNCTTLGDYHDIYLIGDVALLADIFQYFRDLCLRHYQLDPILNFSSPSLSLDAALKMTNVSLDLISDPDMYLTCEQIRGGVAMISKRYAKANNPFMGDEFDSNCNNLYGWSMCQPLPTGRFRWLTSEECNQIDILALQDDSPIGYIFVVDLCYPEHLHDSHNDFPLAPERLQIVESMLSDFQKSLPHSIASSIKLCPNFFPKSSYTVHYRTLKFYLSQGLIHKIQIHKILSFNQSPWLKPYIDFNTDQRKQAKSEFEKSFWKLLNNSVYGKTIENLRKRVRVEVVTDPERAAKLMAKPTLDRFHIIEEDLVILKMKKRNLTLNKPVYIAPSFKISLCFTDTDSFLYHITTPPSADLFSILDKIRDQLDTSDYPLSHPLYSQVNKKVIGKWKDELCGQIMTEFVGLKAKMYSYRVLGGDEKNIGKGVKKHILKNELAFQNYKDTLETYKRHFLTQNLIQSRKHTLYTIEQTKLGLNAFDDKRHLLDDINSLAHGHYKICL